MIIVDLKINEDPRNYKYSSVYGTLLPLSPSNYHRGSWKYVGSEDLDKDGIQWDIVRSPDGDDWRYTLI